VDPDVPEVLPAGLPVVCLMWLPESPRHLVDLVAVGVDPADGLFVLEALVPAALKDEMRAVGRQGLVHIGVGPLPDGVKMHVV
jgi:hypothetical protein